MIGIGDFDDRSRCPGTVSTDLPVTELKRRHLYGKLEVNETINDSTSHAIEHVKINMWVTHIHLLFFCKQKYTHAIHHYNELLSFTVSGPLVRKLLITQAHHPSLSPPALRHPRPRTDLLGCGAHVQGISREW